MPISVQPRFQPHGSSHNKSENPQLANTGRREFFSTVPDKQREIVNGGDREIHESGGAHEFAAEEAHKAGDQRHNNDHALAAHRDAKSHAKSSGRHAKVRNKNHRVGAGSASERH